METSSRRIIILRGIPGSGKSTYAKQLVDEGWNRVSKDDIRMMLNNYKLNNADEGIVHNVQMDIIHQLMKSGRSIVVDNTHARQKYVNELERFITAVGATIEYDYEIQIKQFDTPLEECLRRNALREKPVFEEVIIKMHKQLYG